MFLTFILGVFAAWLFITMADLRYIRRKVEKLDDKI
jgi:hypothetical protein